MKIKDAHGGTRKYRPEKIRKSALRAGFSLAEAKDIEKEVGRRVEGGMSTEKVFEIVYREMKERNEIYAMKYCLRGSIASLKPKYHEFEKFITKLLRWEGVNAEWSPRPKPQGECIDHEVDVIARVDDVKYVVECKHHYHQHRYTGLDVPMRHWARLHDLNQGYQKGRNNSIEVDRAWVIVNTKLSDHAKKYAECKNVRMTAWKYPEEDSLDQIIERNNAYPISMMRPSDHVRTELSKKDILTVRELAQLSSSQKKELDIKEYVLDSLQEDAEEMIED
ncbi:MAG: restriction endonuclease [Candidatus Nanohaloarchaea archaeon]|nr:restriction endonuclease [Candidatus Nanohaloarchaea archaeon]